MSDQEIPRGTERGDAAPELRAATEGREIVTDCRLEQIPHELLRGDRFPQRHTLDHDQLTELHGSRLSVELAWVPSTSTSSTSGAKR